MSKKERSVKSLSNIAYDGNIATKQPPGSDGGSGHRSNADLTDAAKVRNQKSDLVNIMNRLEGSLD